MARAFAEEGLDVSRLKRIDAATGRALILVDDEAQNCIAVCPGANAELTPDDVAAATAAFTAADVVVLQVEVPAPTVAAAIDLAAKCGARVVLNYAPVGDAAVALDGRVDVLVVNETEAAMLAGTTGDAAGLASELRKRGPANVIVTLGASGVVAVDAAGEHHALPAHRVEPVDTTAAGDTFCGALAVRLAEGDGLPAALRYAVVAAALATTKVGAHPSIPTRADVEAARR